MFSLICARINGWVNNREAGDLRRYRAHYDVIVMLWPNIVIQVSQTLFHISNTISWLRTILYHIVGRYYAIQNTNGMSEYTATIMILHAHAVSGFKNWKILHAYSNLCYLIVRICIYVCFGWRDACMGLYILIKFPLCFVSVDYFQVGLFVVVYVLLVSGWDSIYIQYALGISSKSLIELPWLRYSNDTVWFDLYPNVRNKVRFA